MTLDTTHTQAPKLHTAPRTQPRPMPPETQTSPADRLAKLNSAAAAAAAAKRPVDCDFSTNPALVSHPRSTTSSIRAGAGAGWRWEPSPHPIPINPTQPCLILPCPILSLGAYISVSVPAACRCCPVLPMRTHASMYPCHASRTPFAQVA
jgi:hypothetical protein